MRIDLYQAILYGACSATYLLLTTLVILSHSKGATSTIVGGACALTGIWAAALAAALPEFSLLGTATELSSRTAWCGFILYLIGRREGEARRRALAISSVILLVIIFTLGLAPALISIAINKLFGLAYQFSTWAHMALAICGILCVENLYRNTDPDRRWHVNLLCIALGGVFAYDLVFYADAFLNRRLSSELFVSRPIVMILAAPLLAVAAARNRDWAIPIHISRTVVFHTATLVLSGCFLLGLGLAGEVIRSVGADWGGVAEVGLIAAGAMTIGVLLTSGSARSKLRYALAYHFFSHRYDYRQEWLRSTALLSAFSDETELSSRIIRTVAEIADSPAGLLWVRDIEGDWFQWAGSWNTQAVSASEAGDGEFIALFRGGNWIIELDTLRERPDWLIGINKAWLAIPLNHSNRLIGFVVLSQPRARVPLDREMFDLLRIVGRQSAAHLAQQQYAEALVVAQELREYGKRFAFAIHDVKNVISQLRLIVSNSETYGQDPEFQKDAFATVGSAASSLDRLLARMRFVRSDPPADSCTVPIEIIQQYVESDRGYQSQRIEMYHDGNVDKAAISAEDLRSVIIHLCENATEVSAAPINISVRREEERILIDIVDSGPGMAVEFIRDELFLPFRSTKSRGLGIGAFQARELVRAAGGDLLALSDPRGGTIMRIVLPRSRRQPGLASQLT